MKQEAAVELGASALVFLANQPEEIGRFLTVSGVEVATVRARAADPEFLGFVLDFVLSDEALAEAFCMQEALRPEMLAAARAALPGGDAPHWL